jgi:hypothetical protein
LGALSDVLAQIASDLQYVAPTKNDERNLPANDRPPLYVVVLTGARPQSPMEIGQTRDLAKSILDDLHLVDCHCWGADVDDALAMRNALIQVVRKTLSSMPQFEIDDARWTQPKWAEFGWVITQPIGLLVPLKRLVIPTSPMTGTPKDLAEDTNETVQMTKVKRTGAVL